MAEASGRPGLRRAAREAWLFTVPLLFDLKTDLDETTNVADKHPDKVRELEAAIARWSKDLQDPRWPSRPAVTFSVFGTPFVLPI